MKHIKEIQTDLDRGRFSIVVVGQRDFTCEVWMFEDVSFVNMSTGNYLAILDFNNKTHVYKIYGDETLGKALEVFKAFKRVLLNRLECEEWEVKFLEDICKAK